MLFSIKVNSVLFTQTDFYSAIEFSIFSLIDCYFLIATLFVMHCSLTFETSVFTLLGSFRNNVITSVSSSEKLPIVTKLLALLKRTRSLLSVTFNFALFSLLILREFAEKYFSYKKKYQFSIHKTVLFY